MAVLHFGDVPEVSALKEIDKLRTRARRGNANRALKILDRSPDRKPDPGDDLYDLPSSEVDLDPGRPDPWWLMPASLAMWALVALGVGILMTAFVA